MLKTVAYNIVQYFDAVSKQQKKHLMWNNIKVFPRQFPMVCGFYPYTWWAQLAPNEK